MELRPRRKAYAHLLAVYCSHHSPRLNVLYAQLYIDVQPGFVIKTQDIKANKKVGYLIHVFANVSPPYQTCSQAQ